MHKFWSKTKFRNFLTLFKYDPEKYWQTRGKVFFNENPYDGPEWPAIENNFLKYILGLEFSSVLEFGCGFGRITNLMIKKFPFITEYRAVDLSKEQIKNAEKMINSDKVSFEVSTIQDLNVKKKFDLVLGFAVLMHVPPSDIKSVIDKLVSLSSRHVINADWDDVKKPKLSLANFCFLHDYRSLFLNNPRVDSIKSFTLVESPQHSSIFHAEVK